MENYNSFQSIIDAFKAEYVNARNLKKSANSKKRAARNAASFNTRKETESTVLETKLTSIESSLDSTLSTAFDSVDSVRFTDLSKKLAELKGKLSLFDAETDRLTQLVNIDSEKYETLTSREQQAYHSVRNVLVNAISEAESAISDLYTGVDYSSIKSATMPSALTHPASEVVSYFMSLRSTFDSVKDDLKIAVDEYTQDIFEVADIINEQSNQCIQGSKYLLELKSQLADLIDSNAPQTEIDAKEDQIDSHKSNMISSATVLKEAWANFDSFIGDGTSNRFKQIIELAENLEDIYNETIEYKNQNVDVLKVTENFSFDAYSGYRILDVFSEIFDKISDRVSNLLNIEDFNPGDGYRRQQIMGERFTILRSDAEIMSIWNNDIFITNPSTGHYELKKGVNPDLVSNYVTYQTHASYITNLTRKHAGIKSALERFDFYVQKLSGEGHDKLYSITNRYIKSRRSFKELENEYDQLSNGYWTGTQEQTDQRSTLWSSINGVGGLWDSKIEIGAALKMAEARYALHLHLFPEIYSTFETLNSAKASASNDLSISSAQLDTLQDSVTSTYNFLQTLTETDEEYQAAFTTWNNANTEFQSLLAAYDALIPQYELLNNNLTDATNLVNNSLPGSINSAFVYGNGFNGIVYVTTFQSDGKILVGGQFSSYNGTDANSIIRLNTDGSVDTSFVTGYGVQGQVKSIIVLPDGKILVGGRMHQYNEVSIKDIIRLNSDGSLDTSFEVPGTGFNNSFGESVTTMVFNENDGSFLVGGYFTECNGISANGIIKLDYFSGSIHNNFLNNIGTGFGTSPSIQSIVIQSDFKILVGGEFSSYNGTVTKGIVRLNSNGTLDTSFAISTYLQYVTTIAIQSNGKIVVGGNFNKYNPDKDENGEWMWNTGTRVNNILRLNTDGSIDTSFYPTSQTDFPAIKGFSGTVWSIVIQSDDKIVVGGQFDQYCAAWVDKIIRLNEDGSIDTSFVTGSGIQGGFVTTIAIQSNGKIVVGGQFSSYKGTGANKIIQLNLGFGGDAEAGLIAATDALNAFQTDIRIPASNAKDAAEIVVNETYGILQPLTEIDEEYVAALSAWESAVAELETYNNYIYPPVEAAYNAAVYAYESYIQGTYDAVGLPAGTYTRGGGDLADYFNDKQTQDQHHFIANAAFETATSELQTLEGQMTRSTPTENDKRNKVAMNHKSNQAYEMNMKFEDDYLAGIDTLMSIIFQQIIGAKSYIVEIDNYLPGLTADAMAFITGAFGPDINPLFDSFKKAESSHAQRNYHIDMANFENDGFEDYGFHSLGVILNPNAISLIDVQNFQNFVLDLSTYATEKYIEFNRNISTLVINEVENGGSSF